MRERSFKTSVILTSIAFIGLIVSQTFWLNNAIRLRRTQFDYRVSIATRNALDEYKFILDAENKSDFPDPAVNSLDNRKLDSLLRLHFNYQSIDSVFNYEIIMCHADSVVFSKERIQKNHKHSSKHAHPLTELCGEEMHRIEIQFPGKRSFILRESSIWLFGSVFFLISAFLGFYYLIYIFIRQKRISDVKNDFLNNMTHELKTPLSTISLASEMISRISVEGSNQKLKDYSKLIFDENSRLHEQVDRVLQIARFDEANLHLNKEDFDINTLIEDISDKSMIAHPERNIHIDFNPDTTIRSIHADKHHLINVIYNLLDNAIKYSGEKVNIQLSTRKVNAYIIIEVCDHGIGIPKSSQKQVFDKFYRVPTGDIHNVKGFGLGLFYVKTIIENHKGNIQLKSTPGKGSCFSIRLPNNI